MPNFRDRFVRFRRWTRQRQQTRATPESRPPAATPVELREYGDNSQRTPESLETHEVAMHRLEERLNRLRNNIEVNDEEATRAEGVISEAEFPATNEESFGLPIASHGGNAGETIFWNLLPQNAMLDRHRYDIAFQRYRFTSNEAEYDNEGGGQNRSLQENSLPTVDLIAEDIMWAFDDQSSEEEVAMTIWIYQMAAAQIRRDMHRAAYGTS